MSAEAKQSTDPDQEKAGPDLAAALDNWLLSSRKARKSLEDLLSAGDD